VKWFGLVSAFPPWTTRGTLSTSSALIVGHH
jgi:hypothetical protein